MKKFQFSNLTCNSQISCHPTANLIMHPNQINMITNQFSPIYNSQQTENPLIINIPSPLNLLETQITPLITNRFTLVNPLLKSPQFPIPKNQFHPLSMSPITNQTQLI